MLAPRIYRPFLFALAVACGLGLSSNPSVAGDCNTCQQACQACPPNACDCPCYCSSPKPNNYVYIALDKVAGGIEKLLGLDKLNCDSCCDDVGCDDCCEATKLESAPIYRSPVESAPVYRQQTPPASIVPYLDSYNSKTPADHTHPPADSDQWQDRQWLDQPQSLGTPLGEPAAIQPELIEPQVIEPQVIEPQVIDPPVRQAPELTNPFKDDAQVTKKRMVRPVGYDQSRARTDQDNSQDKDPQQRYSRSYTPSKRAVRTLR